MTHVSPAALTWGLILGSALCAAWCPALVVVAVAGLGLVALDRWLDAREADAELTERVAGLTDAMASLDEKVSRLANAVSGATVDVRRVVR